MTRNTTTTALGRSGEDIVAADYIDRGYTLLERNAGYDVGEIDLVLRAPDGDDTIVFVEVKTRSGHGFGAAEAVTDVKLARMRRAAARWLRGRSWVPCRFDVVAVHQSRGRWALEVFEGVDRGAR